MLDTLAVRVALKREWQATLKRVGDLDDGDWARPTRLAGWSIADLVAHFVWCASMQTAAVNGARTRSRTPATGSPASAADGPGTLNVASRFAVSDLLTAVDAIEDGDLAEPAPMPHGPVPLPLALNLFVMEAGLRAWDLAAALGEPAPLADDVVDATATGLAVSVPLLAARGSGAPDGAVLAAFGPTVELRITAAGGSWDVDPQAEPTATVHGSDSDVLLFLLGRIPADAPGLKTGGDGELVARFREYVPGP